MGGVRCLGLFPKKNRFFFFDAFPNLKLITSLTITEFITIFKRPEYREKKVICNFYFHHAQGARLCVNQNFQVLKSDWILLTKDQYKEGK